jgi:glycosyltransferase involved in cell wall biosynthesis
VVYIGPVPLRVGFVYPNPRRELASQVSRGEEPDTGLLGQNYLDEFGFEARIVDSLLLRRQWHSRVAHRMAWNVRDLTAPFEAGLVDVLFTPLANVLPLTARLRRLPVVVVNYGLCLIYERASRLRRRLLVSSLSSASFVLCLGQSQREQLLAQTGLDPNRVCTVPLGVDAHYFTPKPDIDSSQPFVLSVGKDLARDYATLAEALNGLDVRAEVAAFGRNIHGIHFPTGTRAGPVAIDKLRDLYASAAVVVVTQFRDGYPYGSEGGGLTAFLEAAAMAKPIVASDRAILRDYARDGENALLVPPEEPGALREAIEQVLADRNMAQRIGAAARARIEQQSTTRHFAAAIAPFLREAAH